MAKPLEQTPELTIDEFKRFQRYLEAEQHDKSKRTTKNTLEKRVINSIRKLDEHDD